MPGFLLIEQHFLPIYFGNDSNLSTYQKYRDFKEEYCIISKQGKNSKKFSNKVFSDLKKLIKNKKKSGAIIDQEDEGDLNLIDNDNHDDDDFGADSSEDSDDVEDDKESQLDEDQLKGNATLKEVQELLTTSEIFALNFSHFTKLTIILQNGTIIHVVLKSVHSHEYIYIINQLFRFDEPISSVAYGHRYVLFLFPDNRLVVARKHYTSDNTQWEQPEEQTTGLEQILNIQMEVDVSTYTNFLPNLNLKKSDKRLVLNDDLNLFMIWWINSKDDVFPWTPKPEQRANILIYALEEEKEPTLKYFIRTENILLLETCFVNKANEVLTFESSSNSTTGQILVTETIYQLNEAGGTKIKSETTIPIQSTITCYSYSQTHSKLAIGCCDSSIIIHSKRGKITHVNKCTFCPTSLSWHPDSYLLIVIGDQGQFQIFDIALSPILLCSANSYTPSMTQELVPSISTEIQIWAPIDSNQTNSILFMKFRSGELSLLRLPVGRMKLLNLIKFYLADNHISEAISLLKNVQWNSEHCLQAIYCIFGDLIVKKYSEDVEYQLENLLAIYFIPNFEPDQHYRKKHLSSVRILAKKFCMWLVRAGKLDRGLQVANSLRHEGLLRHLQRIAEQLGNHEIAEQADISIRSNVISDESSGTASYTSEDSDSGSCSLCSESCSCSGSVSSGSGSSSTSSSEEDDVGARGQASYSSECSSIRQTQAEHHHPSPKNQTSDSSESESSIEQTNYLSGHRDYFGTIRKEAPILEQREGHRGYFGTIREEAPILEQREGQLGYFGTIREEAQTLEQREGHRGYFGTIREEAPSLEQKEGRRGYFETIREETPIFEQREGHRGYFGTIREEAPTLELREAHHNTSGQSGASSNAKQCSFVTISNEQGQGDGDSLQQQQQESANGASTSKIIIVNFGSV